MQLPPGVTIPFSWVRVRGNRAFISGHGALTPDGAPAGPFGRVPGEVSLEQAQASARLATLAMLASLKAAIGDLDRVVAWLTVDGFVNADPGYAQTTQVLNPCSELLTAVYGPEDTHNGYGPNRFMRLAQAVEQISLFGDVRP
jgi:enamine deaminase RidA (YjgF/YER057c/UK114 family)